MTARGRNSTIKIRWAGHSLGSLLIPLVYSDAANHAFTKAFYFALSIIPALLCCCSSPHAQMRLSVKASSPYESLDIFFFRDDPLERLDAYQRLSPDNPCVAASTRGARIMAVLANSSRDIYSWADINSFEGLQGITVSLEEEKVSHPVMSAVEKIDAGSGAVCEIALEPLLCEIMLESISCDFSGKTYEGCLLEDACVYLTNVNARCSPFAQEYQSISSVINSGGLCDEDLARMSTPSMLYADLPEAIGAGVSHPSLHFYCYPNQAPSESLGTPWTRLVIEGTLDGERWYWPLNINRNDADGIARNTCYSLDVTIMRKGVKDPDIAVGGEIVRVSTDLSPWDEMDNVVLDI